MKFIISIVLFLLIISCAPIYVNYDYERGTDFSRYKTYNYYSDMETGLSTLDTKRLLDALDLKLKEKGFGLSDNPDFFVDIKSSEFQSRQGQTVGVGLGGGGGNMGGGISVGLPIGQPNMNRQITIDFVDENKKQLFWQALSESSFNLKGTPEKREARLHAIVEKILAKYPPEK